VSLVSTRTDKRTGHAGWKSVSDIPDFPFGKFADLQKAAKGRRFNLGVDPLAAAQWSADFNKGFKKVFIVALSLLLVVASLASIAAAFLLGNYWLLLALPIQALAFYVSHPAFSPSAWVTLGGIASLIVFLDLLFSGLPTAATLVAYAGLTFAAVRAAGFVTNSAFRKALLADESLFLTAYANRACTLRDKSSDRLYFYKANQ